LATHPNYLVCLPPSAIGPTRGGTRAAAAPRFGRTNPPRRVGVLIGGNSGAFRYHAADWRGLTQFLQDANRACSIRWLVTTSRRSGTAIAEVLATLAGDPRSGIELLIDFRRPSASLAEIYATADAILCTDDSTSMISEAVGAGLPVVAVRPAAGRLEARERAYRELLAAEGWYRALPLAQLTSSAFLTALEEIAPRTASARDELAAALRTRMPELFAAPQQRKWPAPEAVQPGGGPNTSTALSPPNANEFDME
jgi:mitochondrial fission protein ELM1